MKETTQRQLLCVASIDHASYKDGGPDDDGESLTAGAELVGPGDWAELLEAAKLRETDDKQCDGFVLKAWATDPVSGALVHQGVWTDLCQDQVQRMYEVR